jgi:putative hemolysin
MLVECHDRLALRDRGEQQLLENASTAQFAVSITRCPEAILEAQRLRYRVFAIEGGALLNGAIAGVDADRYDSHCDHLIVRERASGAVVGTYRILPPHVAIHMGFYSDTEFDTRQLAALKPVSCEFGRACVDARYRRGPVIMQLWAGLASYMVQRGYEYVLGLSSVSLADGGVQAASLHARFSKTATLHSAFTVTPLQPLQLQHVQVDACVEAPALMKGYLRVGAVVCGAPAHDEAFGCADFLMLLSLSKMNPRYARHFGINQCYNQALAA